MSSNSKKSLRQRRKEETRVLILETAGAMFLKENFNGVSIEDIAKKVGLSKGAVFYHFATKEELAIESVKWFIQHKLSTSLQDSELSTSEMMRKFISESIALTTDYPGMLNFLLQILARSNEEEKIARVMNAFQDMFQSLTQPVASAFKEQEKANPELKTLLLFAMMDGIGFYLSMQDLIKHEILKADHLDVLVDEIMKLFFD
ncbi:MAG: TetR/AcrR family transcriptional regulator [Candidatus Hodarchaeales archaeon]|jgi:AcrR family transcriptional regulator